MRIGRFLLTVAIVCSLSLVGQAFRKPGEQSRPATSTIKLVVTVEDRQKQVVRGLPQEAFEIRDNNRPQPIVRFGTTAQSLTLILMLDTSLSMTQSISGLKDAIERFLIRLPPEDVRRVGTFGEEALFTSPFITDPTILAGAVRQITTGQGRSTRLFDTLSATLGELRQISGQRVIVLCTDGYDTTSRTGPTELLAQLRADDVHVYAISRDPDPLIARLPGEPEIKKLVEETGGAVFAVSKESDLPAAFARLGDELHGQYVLEFIPTQRDGRRHDVTVKINRDRLTARTRRSYIAAKSTP